MKAIPLKQGVMALVDDIDFDRLNESAWRVSSTGYVVRGNRSLKMHREILALALGDARQVDHINGNKLDNTRANLRMCTSAQNKFNTRRRSDNTSGFKGVSAVNNVWIAMIRANGKRHYLGQYKTPEEAHEVYSLWADMLHGEFANYGN
jgi:hypothetical protein